MKGKRFKGDIDATVWGKTALQVVDKMAGILADACNEEPDKFLRELRELVEKAKDDTRGELLMTPEQFEATFLIICMAMVAVFGEIRKSVPGDKKEMIDEAVEMVLPHLHMIGIQGILAMERLRLN